MTDPLRLSFDVDCSVEHAFDTWTSRIGTWWPRDHTVAGADTVAVVLERHSGGRIFERTSDGTEHDWGQIAAWEPPHRFAYRWHLAQDPAEATDVEIRFIASESVTRVEIEHSGWERLGDRAENLRDRNQYGWSSLLPHFISSIETSST